MPSTTAKRLQRLMASAASSMNCCGFPLEIVEAATVAQHLLNRTTRELRSILEIREQVG